jgi:transcription elongation factor GreB
MSRGFVKEDDLEHAGTDVPERPVSAHINYVTLNGYAQLEQWAAALENQRKILNSNKDNNEAIAALAIVHRDLRYVSSRLESALITKPELTATLVLFGAKVTVEDENGKRNTYEIVGEDEADIKINKVSWVSPLATALIGQKVDDAVVWKRPIGDHTLTIIAIEYTINS